nr:hypothetical protein [Klebsiella pneumoniae]
MKQISTWICQMVEQLKVPAPVLTKEGGAMAKAFEGAKPPSHDASTAVERCTGSKGRTDFSGAARTRLARRRSQTTEGNPRSVSRLRIVQTAQIAVARCVSGKEKRPARSELLSSGAAPPIPIAKALCPSKVGLYGLIEELSMFGTIILTAMLTTSSATAEDAGKNIASGLAAASASQMGQAVMPTLATSSAIAKSAGKGMVSGLAAATASYIPQDELSFTRSYKL